MLEKTLKSAEQLSPVKDETMEIPEPKIVIKKRVQSSRAGTRSMLNQSADFQKLLARDSTNNETLHRNNFSACDMTTTHEDTRTREVGKSEIERIVASMDNQQLVKLRDSLRNFRFQTLQEHTTSQTGGLDSTHLDSNFVRSSKCQ